MQLDKVTRLDETSARRSYADACGAAFALDLVGERWALLVMRELMLGPKRFGDLRADLPGISANVLTQRLEGLEASGVLLRRRLPPPAAVQVYELTPWGYEAEPIFQALGRWAVRSPQHDPTLAFSAVSMFLSFRTMIDPARAAGLTARIGFRLAGQDYVARIVDGGIVVAREQIGEVDLLFEGTPPAIAALVYAGVPLAQLEAGGALAVTGDRALFARFLTVFPLPDKLAPTA